jgi:hypothetical protein
VVGGGVHRPDAALRHPRVPSAGVVISSILNTERTEGTERTEPLGMPE